MPTFQPSPPEPAHLLISLSNHSVWKGRCGTWSQRPIQIFRRCLSFVPIAFRVPLNCLVTSRNMPSPGQLSRRKSSVGAMSSLHATWLFLPGTWQAKAISSGFLKLSETSDFAANTEFNKPRAAPWPVKVCGFVQMVVSGQKCLRTFRDLETKKIYQNKKFEYLL